MTAKRAGAVVLLAAALPIAWLAIASLVFLAGTGLWGHPAIPRPTYPWQWLVYRPYFGRNAAVSAWLVAGAVAGAAPVVLGLIAAAKRWHRLRSGLSRPGIARGVSDNHGHADWLPMATARRDYPGPRGVVVGEAYRPDLDLPGVRHKPRDPATWGRGGTAPLLVDPCDEGSTHSMRIAGPGGNKTAAAVTMLAHPDAAWPGSLFVLDPSNEIGPLCRDARRDMGQRVVSLDLARAGLGMDALADVDPASPRAVQDVLAITAELCGEEPSRHRDAVFDNAGRNLIACLLAHMLSDPAVPPERRTLATFLEAITTPENRMKALLRGVHGAPRDPGDGLGRAARMLAGIVLGLAEETFSGAYFNATQFVAWLFDGRNAGMLSGGGFRASDLAGGGVAVFCHIPLEALMHAPGVARVAVGAAVRAMIAADGRHAERLLVLTDERRRLGRMVSLEVARDQGRKYGITLHDIYQSNAQVKEVSGPGGPDAWFNALSWRAYGAVADLGTARDLSEMCGEHGVLAASEGGNEGTSGRPMEWSSRSKGRNTNTHEIRRRLIKVEEILQDMRTDEQIVVRPGSRPLRCGVAAYYRRPEVVGRVGSNRFARSPDETAP